MLISLYIAILVSILVLLFTIELNGKNKWVFGALSLLLIIIIGAGIYDYFKTLDSYYKEEYKRITQMNFPKDGEIVYSTNAPWFSFNGDHTSAFLVELNRTDIQLLKKSLKQRDFEKGSGLLSDQLDYIESKLGSKAYEEKFSYDEKGDTYMVGFLDDGISVVLVLVDI